MVALLGLPPTLTDALYSRGNCEFTMARFRPEESAILARFGRTGGRWLIMRA